MTCYADRTFTFNWLYPPSSYFLKKVAGVEKAANQAGHEIVGRVTVQQIYEIAALKIKDFDKQDKKVPIRTLARSLVAQCRNMGLEVYCPSSSTPGDPDFLAKGDPRASG